MTDADGYRLLHGPYVSPPLGPGDRTECLVRDCNVKVTSWTIARIFLAALPSLRPEGRRWHPGRCGVAFAVCFESALAITYWWGASAKTVAWWRRVLGMNRINNDGSHRLIVAASAAGGEVTRSKPMTPDQVERRAGGERTVCRGKPPAPTNNLLAQAFPRH